MAHMSKTWQLTQKPFDRPAIISDRVYWFLLTSPNQIR